MSAVASKRTKKTKGAEVLTTVGTVAVEAVEPVAESVTPSKKKTKKPIKVVAVVTPNGIEGSFMPEPRRPLIAHLQIRSSEINFQEKETAEPEPYNPATSNMFAGDQGTMNFSEEFVAPEATKEAIYTPTDVIGATEARPLQCYAKIKLMVQFEETSKARQLPTSIDTACFWCAHTFEGTPCVIPEREVAGVYNVYGNFCCPECGLAYVLNETIDPHVRWERIALLHRIYDREGKGRMFPAPARDCLKLFGGPLSIESYRATVRQGKVRIDLHMPPMVSILGSIDTKPIDFFDSSIKNTLIGGLQMEKTTKAEEGLRLKRTKPLKDRDSTLDSVMNIQIKGVRR